MTQAVAEHEKVAQALNRADTGAGDATNLFCLMPLLDGQQFGHSGFLVDTQRIDAMPETTLKLFKFLERSITTDVPPDVWQFLPLIPQADYAPIQVREQVAALLRKSQRLAHRAEGIAPLAASLNDFDRQLLARFYGSAQGELESLLPMVEEAKHAVTSLPYEGERATAHNQIMSFLEKLELLLRTQSWPQLLKLETFGAASILDALDTLVKRQS